MLKKFVRKKERKHAFDQKDDSSKKERKDANDQEKIRNQNLDHAVDKEKKK